ncbi:SlyX family protein [Cellvibrio sp. pealriver]|uniref:SlyX family protein n=1 Tax=Cellvibrio sp. pealriver TaxID=1622269 RepID=UPI00066FF563|nr:SlyX family protein [Cellvibrio sp. pealriver]
MSDLEEQLIDVQTRVAYQEDTLAQLNEVITRQDAEIIQLKQQLRLLALRIDEIQRNPASAGDDISNERPPHY